MPRPLPVVLGFLTALAPTTSAFARQPADVEVVIEGKGWGHGVGMAQDGAYSLAAGGASVDEILAHFYPGTTLGRSSGTVHVNLLEAPRAAVTLAFPSGGEVRATSSEQPPGFPVSVSSGGSVRLSFEGGAYRATPLAGATPSIGAELASSTAPTAPVGAEPPPATTTTSIPTLLGLIPLGPSPATTPTTTPAPPSEPPATAPPEPPPDPTSGAPLVALPEDGSTAAVGDEGRRYRGSLRAVAEGAGLQLVNELDVEQYLLGMGEVLDAGWPAAALEAQAIAARTYALDAMASGRGLCSTQQCQVYLGQSAEYAAMNRAVATTRGQVLLYRGSLAEAVYSANAGGVSATPEEGFGRSGDDYPYLRSVSYPSADPKAWAVRTTLTDLAARMGYPGQASRVVVTRTGPSGRALEVTFIGDAGSVGVEGRRFAETLRLQSTFFQIRLEGADQPGSDGAHRPPLSKSHRPPLVLAAGHADPAPLGRTPWAALGVLLLAGWGAAAQASRVRLGKAPAVRPEPGDLER